jgi:hypothetical protein
MQEGTNMLRLTIWQVLEIFMGSASVTIFVVLFTLLRLSNRRNGDHCALGCSLLIPIPLAIVGLYMLADALARAV